MMGAPGRKMRVLVACEYSGAVRDAFTAAGHYADSCDLLPAETPGMHHQRDVLEMLGMGWDLMIAHPPCTFLCSSGLHWNKRQPERAKDTAAALEFVRHLLGAPIPMIALENPVGAIGTHIRPADQYIHPHQYGHDASKRTGLWLKNLPLLVPTRHVAPRLVCCGAVLENADRYGCPNCHGENRPAERWANQTDSGQNRLAPSPDRWKERSRTYSGIAAAMAAQWGAAPKREAR